MLPAPRSVGPSSVRGKTLFLSGSYGEHIAKHEKRTASTSHAEESIRPASIRLLLFRGGTRERIVEHELKGRSFRPDFYRASFTYEEEAKRKSNANEVDILRYTCRTIESDFRIKILPNNLYSLASVFTHVN